MKLKNTNFCWRSFFITFKYYFAPLTHVYHANKTPQVFYTGSKINMEENFAAINWARKWKLTAQKQSICFSVYMYVYIYMCVCMCSMTLRSLSWNTCVVIDGQCHYDIPRGTIATCSLNSDDLLTTLDSSREYDCFSWH